MAYKYLVIVESPAKINYGEILLDKNILVTGGNSGIGYEIEQIGKN